MIGKLFIENIFYTFALYYNFFLLICKKLWVWLTSRVYKAVFWIVLLNS